MLKHIVFLRQHPKFKGPWVLVNAWAIYDRRSEPPPFLGDYTENLGLFGAHPHPFIRRIEHAAGQHLDIVFSAGNCGEVCPDGRCGPDDYGRGRSIWGANAHRAVLTAGAVRVDGNWLGFSSEGPGPTPHLYANKPDLCTPAQFVGTSGLYPPDTGTSCSAAVAAGAVSLLRSQWNQSVVPPQILKLILNDTARQTDGSGWNQWFGNGIMDLKAAYDVLAANFP